VTDPIYGDNPIDVGLLWDSTFRPPLVNDAEMKVWRAVVVGAVDEKNESSWLIRWRVGSVLTAEGVHMDNLGDELKFPRPDGWDDDRYRAALVPIEGVVLTLKVPARTVALAAGLTDAQPGQSFKVAQLVDIGAAYCVAFFGVSANEMQTYRVVMEYGRPKGVEMCLVFSPFPEDEVFTIEVSEIGGPDVIADAF
jgi:hypothetical protein